MSPVVEARAVSKVYETGGQSLVALNDVSLELHAGELVSIIGPSGCGKSTLLAILGGLTAPTTGGVLVEGQELVAPRPDRIGVVFQEYSLLPWRTARENAELGLEVRGVRPAERRRLAERYLDLVGLSHFANAYPHQLSGGMRQRVAIARCLCLGCNILLLDEPFGALDEQTRLMMGQELLAIHAKTRSCIALVTHSLSEAVYLADRIALMGSRPGTVSEIFDVPLPKPRVPAHRTSAAFLRLYETLWERLQAQWTQDGAPPARDETPEAGEVRLLGAG